MGKRTSDFVALAAILGGAGLGLGVTGLFVAIRAASAPHADDSSIEVRIVRGNIIVNGGKSISRRRGPRWFITL